MCDYSAEFVLQRAAAKNDTLVSQSINVHTRGFVDKNDRQTAVCLLPGTEIAFKKPVRIESPGIRAFLFGGMKLPHTTARFVQVNRGQFTHHDALEFYNGDRVLLTHLVPGQVATVVQLPVDPAALEGQARAKSVTREVEPV